MNLQNSSGGNALRLDAMLWRYTCMGEIYNENGRSKKLSITNLELWLWQPMLHLSHYIIYHFLLLPLVRSLARLVKTMWSHACG